MKRCLFTCLCISIIAVVHATTLTLPDGAIYEGELLNGRLHGEGSLRWPGGSSYIGGFKNGLMQGEGTYTFADGSVYVGGFVAGAQQGSGQLTDAYGNIYQGTYEQNEFIEGTMTDAQGTVYEGRFLQYRLNGEGKLSFAEGSDWQGQFVDGVLTGTARFRGSNGETYIGDVLNGQYHGTGELTRPDGTRYVGEFEAGYYHGTGTYSLGSQTYTGGFQYGNYSGSGRYTSEGITYEGEFESGYYNGEGTLTLANGDVFRGEFEWGELVGNALIEYANGNRYEGELYRGQFNGQGTFFDREASLTQTGIWRGGELVINQTGERFKLTSSVEAALNEHPERLQSMLKQLPEGNPNEIELYFVGIAGDGSQRVFEREVLSAQTLLNERFDLNARSALLINSFEASDDFPLATVDSIEKTLSTVAEKMNAEQDILFVYMTSHGSPDHEFYLNHNGMSLVDLPSHYFSQMIESLPVTHKVIGISACYSGGFIPSLEDKHHLVFSSAHKNNTSFGCSDDNDFTYFGRALFQEALMQTHSFRHAFHMAYEQVTEWETEQNFEPSKPQISAPEPILTALDNWIASIEKPMLNPSDTVLARWWLRETVQGATH